MKAIRIIPSTDDGNFPYEAVRHILLQLEGLETGEVDFPAMIESGMRMGWSKEMVEANWDLMKRGKCFTFHQGEELYLQGTMYEDNVYFVLSEPKHEDSARNQIARIAESLKLRVFEH